VAAAAARRVGKRRRSGSVIELFCRRRPGNKIESAHTASKLPEKDDFSHFICLNFGKSASNTISRQQLPQAPLDINISAHG